MNYNYHDDDDDEGGGGSRVKFYGTPFPQLKEDEAPSKKPDIDLTVRDEEGRRRFHGAFTGGFSAGYWNTVGSKEGWVPSQFVSSRKEKWDKDLVKGKPEDFMDEEDFMVHGIAPKSLHTTELFSSDPMSDFLNKRLPATSQTPASGESDLVDFLKQAVRPAKMSIGVQILKKMKRSSKSLNEIREKAELASAALNEAKSRHQFDVRKKRQKKDESLPADRTSSARKSFGCSLPPGFTDFQFSSDDDDDEEADPQEVEHESPNQEDEVEDDVEHSFACYKLPFEPKNNPHGLGYKGMLQPSAATSAHSSKSLSLSADVAGRKLHITGDAFGTGVLDEENEAFDDVALYEKEDMSIYDFEMRGEKRKKSKNLRPTLSDYGNRSLDEMFVPESHHTSSASKFQSLSHKYPPPEILSGWRPKPPFPSKENTPPRDERRSNDPRDECDKSRKRSRWDVRSGQEEGHKKSGSSLTSPSASCPPSTSKSSSRSMVGRVMDANVRSVLLGEGIKLPATRLQSVTEEAVTRSSRVKEEPVVQERDKRTSASDGRLNHPETKSSTPTAPYQRTPLFGFFANKFTHSSSSSGSDAAVKLEAGLTRPEDIRTSEMRSGGAAGDGDQSQESSSLIGTSDRISLPFVPTSLLCKRFNVPQPGSGTRSKHH